MMTGREKRSEKRATARGRQQKYTFRTKIQGKTFTRRAIQNDGNFVGTAVVAWQQRERERESLDTGREQK